MPIKVGELVPSYITIDPTTGQVSADFSGKVHAAGIVLPTYLGAGGGVPQGSSQILFVRNDNGTIVGVIQSQGNNGEQTTVAARAINDSNAADTSSVTLVAQDSTGTGRSGMIISQSAPGAIPKASISLIAENLLPLLLDQDGKSEFARLEDRFNVGRAQLIGQPARFRRAAALGFPAGNFTSMQFDTITYDDGSHADNSAGHEQFLVPTAGYFLVLATTRVSIANAGGFIELGLFINGANVSAVQAVGSPPVGAGLTALAGGDILKLAANDLIDVRLWSNNGENMFIDAASNFMSVQQIA